MDFVKTAKDHRAALLVSLCEVIVGVLLLVNPVRFTSGIIIALGTVLALAGAVNVVKYFRSAPLQAAQEQRLSKGLVMLLAGVFCVFRSGWFIATFPVLTLLYGVGLLVVGLTKVQWTVDLLRLKHDFWFVAGIGAAASIVCGAIIIGNPFGSTVALWIFIGIALLAEAVCDLLAVFMRRKRQV